MTKFLLAIILICSVAAASPVWSQEKDATKKSKDVYIHTSTSPEVHTEQDSSGSTTRMVHRSSEDGLEIELSIKGVHFNDDYTNVESVTQDGFLLLRETRAGHRRKLEIEPDARGQLKYSYSVQGEDRPFDAEARGWLAQAIKERVENGFEAKERVARIYRTQGARGVLETARELKTGYARSTYYGYLLKIEKPRPETVREVIEQTARDKFSDYERATLLTAIAKDYLSGSQGRAEFFESVKRIESDYYRSEVLIPLLKRDDLDKEWALLAVRAVVATSSDYEKARVLLAASKEYPDNERVRAAIIEMAASIGSEYYRNSVLAAVARAKKATTTEL